MGERRAAGGGQAACGLCALRGRAAALTRGSPPLQVLADFGSGGFIPNYVTAELINGCAKPAVTPYCFDLVRGARGGRAGSCACRRPPRAARRERRHAASADAFAPCHPRPRPRAPDQLHVLWSLRGGERR